MRKILMVCTGNICRSPMAEVLIRFHLHNLFPDEDLFIVESAGTRPILSEATDEAVEVMRESGFDLSGHRSRRVDRDFAASFDLILVMQRYHLDNEAFKVHLNVFTLGDYAGEGEEVPDPYGRGIKKYREVYDLLNRLTESAAHKIGKCTVNKQ